MSTVIELFDEIQDRIPMDRVKQVLPALNKAVSMIAKRLYVHESDLIIGELSVSIFAQDAYTAATIGFLNNVNLDTDDTITDSASQFVAEGFVANMPITTTCATNPGPFKISSVAVGVLTLDSKSKLTTQAAGSSYTITSANDFGYLPADFWGFVGRPYVSGYKDPLYPLPGQHTQLFYSNATGVNTGTPTYYKLQGDKLRILPATGTDITIKGDYFQKPTKLTDLNDETPFNGVLDDALSEYLLMVLGGDAPAAASALQEMLFSAVDLIVPKRSIKGPEYEVHGIQWNAIE